MKLNHLLCIYCLFAAAPATLFAVDGVILIDQNKALAGNITPGDAPGFPVTITQSGSYRLDGNLILPDVYTDGIDIQADNVTIDLNGFSIIGPNVCTIRVTFGISAVSCAPGGRNGTGRGIFSVNNNIMIRNGKIQGTGADGITLSGLSLIEGVQVRSVPSAAMLVYGGIVKDCATDTSSTGIYVYDGTISSTVIQNHPSYGIEGGYFILTNSVISNTGVAIAATTYSSYSGNILTGNGSNASGGAINMGQNVCDNAICP